MSKTLAYGYSYESTQRELSSAYHYLTGFRYFSKIFASLCLDESSLSIGRVKQYWLTSLKQYNTFSHSILVFVILLSANTNLHYCFICFQDLTTSEQQKQTVVQKLVQCEQHFLDIVQAGIQSYLQPLKSSFLTQQQHQAIFQNLEKVRCFL